MCCEKELRAKRAGPAVEQGEGKCKHGVLQALLGKESGGNKCPAARRRQVAKHDHK